MGFVVPRFGDSRSISRPSISTTAMFYTVNSKMRNKETVFSCFLFLIRGCYSFSV